MKSSLNFQITSSLVLKSIALISLSLLELFLISVVIPECSDLKNYLAFNNSSLENVRSDILSISLLVLIGNNRAWIATMSFLSILIYNVACFISNTSNTRRVILCSLPFTASIVGVHYWGCAIRNGLAISLLILSLEVCGLNYNNVLVELKHEQYIAKGVQKFRFIFVNLLAILSHWSSLFVVIILLLALFGDGFKFYVRRMLLGFMGRLATISLGLIAIIVSIVGFYLTPKISAVLNELYLTGVDYGRYLPFVTVCLCALLLLLDYNVIFQNSLSRVLVPVLLVLSIIPTLLSVNSTIIRLNAPIWFIFMYAYFQSTKKLYIIAPISIPFLSYIVLKVSGGSL